MDNLTWKISTPIKLSGKLNIATERVIPQGYADVSSVEAIDEDVTDGVIYVNSSGEERTGTSQYKTLYEDLNAEIGVLNDRLEVRLNGN